MTASAANQVLDRCASTNDVLKELGELGYPHGTWVSARVQESGRGRLGRKWESLEGNLFLSVLARIEPQQLWTWVPMAAAVGAALAIRRLFPEAPVQLKWPNDLWLERRKLGGILCEAIGNRMGSFIVIGIGVNCAARPEGLDQDTQSLSDFLKRPVSADDVRADILEGILESLGVLSKLGTSEIARRFEALSVLEPGTEIQWQAHGAGELLRGIVEGLGPSGELKVQVEGKTASLFAEDVKLRL